MNTRFSAVSKTLLILALFASSRAFPQGKAKQPKQLPDVCWVTFSSDGKLLAAGSGAGSIVIWDVTSERQSRILSGHRHSIKSIKCSKKGKILVSLSHSEGVQDVKLWDVKTGKDLRHFGNPDTSTESVSLSTDGRILALGAFRGVTLVHVQSGERMAVDVPKYVALSPDGKTLVSAGYEGSVKFWNVATGRLLNTLTRKRGNFAAVSPNGKILAWGTKDGKVSLWNTKTGKEYRVLTPKSK